MKAEVSFSLLELPLLNQTIQSRWKRVGRGGRGEEREADDKKKSITLPHKIN